jgi:hypothetical protein
VKLLLPEGVCCCGLVQGILLWRDHVLRVCYEIVVSGMLILESHVFSVFVVFQES